MNTLFIGGSGRSGTTLFERVLARSGSAVALGEVMHLWQRGVVENQLCGCGRPFHECPFWGHVGELAFGGWERVDTGRMEDLRRRVDRARMIPLVVSGVGGASLTRDINHYADHYRRVYAAAALVSGRDVVLDSSKQVSLPFLLAGRADSDLRVAQMVRDPRGVAYSWTKSVTRPEIVARSELMPRYSPRQTSVTWLVHNAGFDLARLTGIPVRRWRYESLVTDPATVATEVGSFAGLTFDQTTIAQLKSGFVELSVDHTCAGNPLRFRQGRLDFALDDDWRRQLPARQRKTVSRWTSPLRYAYRRSDPKGESR